MRIIVAALVAVVVVGCGLLPNATATPTTAPMNCFRHVITDPPAEHTLHYVLYTDKLDISLTYWVKAYWKEGEWYIMYRKEPLCDKEWCFVWKPIDCKE